MPQERRYFIVRLCLPDESVHFVLLPDSLASSGHLELAEKLVESGREWFAAHPSERERLALVIREFGHHLATTLEQSYPELSAAGVDAIQNVFSSREIRLQMAGQIGPSVAASLISEGTQVLQKGRVPNMESMWRQVLGQRGAVKLFLRTLLTMHQQNIAHLAAAALSLPWRPSRLTQSTVTEIPIPLDAFTSGPSYLYVMNNLPYHALREALALRSFAASEDSPWPTATIKRGATQGQAQLFPVEMEINPYREANEQQQLIDRMWRQVSDLNDLDADVLDMMSALWIQQARNPNDFARISVKQLLEMRGLKPKTGEGGRASGFRPEQKQQLFQAIQHISSLFLLIYDFEPPRGGDGKNREHRELRSRAFVITDVMGNRAASGISMEIEEFLIRPGVLFGHFLFGPGRQIALLSSKAIQYDRVRQEWEKRLSRYFSWVWRNDATNDRPIRSFLVRTLLEAAGKQIDQEHPKRTRDRLEKALNQLQRDQVIASWAWDRDRNSNFREPRNWQDYWMEWGVRIEMPPFIQKHYQNITIPGFSAPASSATPAKALSSSAAASTNATEELPLEARLFAWRKERSHSQADMASMLGITQSYYSHLERGSRTPPEETRRRIEALLARPL
jgi:DNA-binding XRE family transcriptional regulator